MILGPLNGGLPWPKEYPELRRREREWLIPLRNLHRWLPYHRSMYRNLSAVISGSRHTATEIPPYFQGRRYYLPENGIDPGRFPIKTAPDATPTRFRFLTTGRLVPLKGVDIILEAMAHSEVLRGCELQIIGEGPQRNDLERQVREYGLDSSVRFLGWLEQKDLGQYLRSAQAFVFPSLKDFGGGSVLEAMASGLPPIVVDYGGPGELATPETGILIPMAPREQLVPALTKAMETLAQDPERAQSLGEAAQRRAHSEFTWDAKAEKIVSFYREILDRAPADPPLAEVGESQA